jgi:serine protease AprX
MPLDRRTFVKGAGVAAGTAALPGPAAARIDDKIDLDGGLQEIVVVFEQDADVSVLDRLTLPEGYHEFQALPYVYTKATGDVIESIAELESARWIDYNHEIEFHNDDTREMTGAQTVHDEFDITGEGVHVALIDTGIAPHPDLVGKIENNYRYVNPLSNYSGESTWVDAGPGDVDDIGHGTHVAGTFGGDGTASDGQYAGTAPGVDKITSYRVDGPRGLFLHVVSALDDLVAKQRDGDVDIQLINNSWGWNRYGDFNPNNAVNLAFWELFNEGILSLFSAGNDSDFDTINPYARAPYIATIAATHTGDDGQPKVPTGFSSQGRPPESEMGDGYARGFEMDYEGTEGAQYDRKTALENIKQYQDADQMDAPAVEADYVSEFTADVPTGTYGVLGIGGTSPEEPNTVEWESPPGAGAMSVSVTWEPRNQGIEVTVYETDNPDNAVGPKYPANYNDGRAVIEIDAEIDPETSYTFTFRGQGNVDAEATVNIEVLQDVTDVDGPLGVYRPAVGAPGNLITSTTPPSNVLYPLAQLDSALGNGGQDNPLYGPLSGTSMSCPATTGVAALVFEAYRKEAGFNPKPIDVINILEATAEGGTDDELSLHHEANMGAGFVDAVAAVELAQELAASVSDQSAPSGDTSAEAEHPELWEEVELCSFEARR